VLLCLVALLVRPSHDLTCVPEADRAGSDQDYGGGDEIPGPAGGQGTVEAVHKEARPQKRPGQRCVPLVHGPSLKDQDQNGPSLRFGL